jgi:hypothetical protein
MIKPKMSRAGHVARMGKWRTHYNILVRKPEDTLGRLKRKWEGNNYADFRIKRVRM